jgi:sigma-B regulation protein RsbU (phosphoserine phosphatase)
MFASVFDDSVPVDPIWVGGIGYRLVMAGFFVSNTLLVGRLFGHIEKLHVTTVLWRLFITGMAGITLIMVITFLNRATSSWAMHKYLGPIFFALGFYAFTLFFLACVFIFRRFILYPRTKRKIIAWQIFFGMLAVGVAFLFFRDGLVITISYIPFVLLTLFLGANVRWIAYLNFNQKLRTMGLLVMILLVMVTYVIAARNLPGQLGVTPSQSWYLVFLVYIVIFALTYTIISILVLFFNLPTSSIFEAESFEIASASKISQAIQSNLDFTDIMNTLLEASMLAANARAGWVEMLDEKTGQTEIKVAKRLGNREVQQIRQGHDLTEKVLREGKPYLVRNLRKHRGFQDSDTRYRSLIVVPVGSNNQGFGAVFVVNELVNAFEDVTLKSLMTFAEQAGIALENARLIRESIEVERYREQLKIAKEVQDKLLPHSLPGDARIQMAAENENAYEVGGDYYDVLQYGPDMYRVAIGDVSGKGTTAAFYMAETKGIFHSLALLDLDVSTFIATANQALSQCMQKGFFLTMTYLQIDLKQQEVSLIRAGHCPTFYYEAATRQVHRLDEGILGLGILRNRQFDRLVGEPVKIPIVPGDFLVLYTDGITEARNQEGEEFGYDRLQEEIYRTRDESAPMIASEIVSSVKNFAHSELHDDYTILVIKFLPQPTSDTSVEETQL